MTWRSGFIRNVHRRASASTAARSPGTCCRATSAGRGWWTRWRASRTPLLCQDPLHHVAMHVRQPVVPPLELERQPGVVDAEQVQQRRLEVVDVYRVLRHVVGELV